MKASTGRVGPGPNYFSASNVRVDAKGRLHLRIAKTQGRWYSAEIGLDHSLGYGTYTWTLASRVDQLDANAVLGLFTYDDTSPAHAHREIDIEASRSTALPGPQQDSAARRAARRQSLTPLCVPVSGVVASRRGPEVHHHGRIAPILAGMCCLNLSLAGVLRKTMPGPY